MVNGNIELINIAQKDNDTPTHLDTALFAGRAILMN
jgi:hypothetical protein